MVNKSLRLNFKFFLTSKNSTIFRYGQHAKCAKYVSRMLNIELPDEQKGDENVNQVSAERKRRVLRLLKKIVTFAKWFIFFYGVDDAI